MLAVQPSFLFTKNGHVESSKIMSIPHNEQENNLTNNVNIKLSPDDLDLPKSNLTLLKTEGVVTFDQIDRSSLKYIIGVCFCLYAAIASSAINVLQVQKILKY